MNVLNWLTPYIDIGQLMQYFGIISKKRKSSGLTLLVSVLAIGIGALYVLGKDRKDVLFDHTENFGNQVKQILRNVKINPFQSGMTEFAKVVMPMHNREIINNKAIITTDTNSPDTNS
ncbi:hypothetical protein [Bacillus sp. Marseille-P3661]|uniref:hypothetical protein n=1 Tax=Bacillus sp. Marseille-P3661 TaxID=1936234 RepID=UPI000C83E164|nr:hypothetical protein [Bacillus sp. Marseille-P3661]